MADTITIDVIHFALNSDPGSGQRLVNAIEEALISGKSVCLDFNGIEAITSSFLNKSLRVTAALHTPQFIKSAITMVNINPQIRSSLQDIFSHEP
jgi:hypothetical protein